jgi:uncharacterized paraquat-inducible protein A
MKSKIIKKKLIILLKHLQYYNKLAPFPVYDTDYVKDVENKLNEIMENTKHNYDEDSVVACKHCKSLHIKNDELDNGICFKCGSINELIEFKNIYEYNKLINDQNS